MSYMCTLKAVKGSIKTPDIQREEYHYVFGMTPVSRERECQEYNFLGTEMFRSNAMSGSNLESTG